MGGAALGGDPLLYLVDVLDQLVDDDEGGLIADEFLEYLGAGICQAVVA